LKEINYEAGRIYGMFQKFTGDFFVVGGGRKFQGRTGVRGRA
jgi:hypothetical protein